MAISRNTYTVSRAILATLGVVGFISVAVLAPNALQMFKNFDIAGKKKKYKKQDKPIIIKFNPWNFI